MRRRAAALAVAAMCAACGRADPGTDVQRLQLDLAFGVKVAGAPAPPNFGAGVPLDVPDARVPEAPRLPPKFQPPLATVVPCPEAALNAFPAREATFNVEQTAPDGLYRWRRAGSQTLTSVPGVTLPVGGFEARYVRRARKVSETRYTFQTVQPGAGQQSVVTTWTVNTAATAPTVNPVVGPPVRTGDPERGLVLSKIETYDSKNKLVGTFTPTPGILFLGLPVVAGEQWSAQGVDTATGQALQHTGTVVGRERVDACGDIVDGWRVNGQQTLQDANGRTVGTRTYNYIVATQLGGMVVLEFVDGQTADGTLKATYSIGQLAPGPLPADVR